LRRREPPLQAVARGRFGRAGGPQGRAGEGARRVPGGDRLEAVVQIPAWLPAIACAALLLFILSRRATVSETSPARIALLYGIRRQWGETDASLRERSAAASRGSSGEQQPRFAWWARTA